MELAKDYYSIMAKGRVYNQKSADYSNAATHDWYINNGYILEPVPDDNEGRHFRYVKAK